MTEKQLEQIREFVLSLDDKIDQFHDSRHAELTVNYAFLLAKDFPETNLKLLEAACLLHDIGRINAHEGHARESAKLAEPFLQKIGLPAEEIEIIVHAIAVHNISDIHTAKTIEAKLLFDADKIQQLSVYGFLRLTAFLIADQKMDMVKAVETRWEKVQKIWNEYIQTEKAKEMLRPEMEKVEEIVKDFRRGLEGKLGKN